MEIVLMSDIHANLPALEAVLADIGGAGEGLFHLGDLVGYAPWPNEVIGVLRAREIPGVSGNYDSTVAADYKHCGCKYEDARQEALSHVSFRWTLEHTSAASKRYLASLPFRLDLRPLGGHTSGPRLIMVHGNPVLNTVYWTADRSDAFAREMAERAGARRGDVLAFGHTHKPWHREIDGVHYLNAGSVGRPKDGDPRAGYVRLTMRADGVEVAFVRVEYDVERACAAIVAHGLPADFADHLRSGGT